MTNSQYLTKARKLDGVKCFSLETDVEARFILQRLKSYPQVREQCVGAFAECSSDVHLLLREAARSTAMRHWRQVEVGAASPWRQLSRPTRPGTTAIGELSQEPALQGPRLRFSQAYLLYLPANLPSLQGPLLPDWYDRRDLVYQLRPG